MKFFVDIPSIKELAVTSEILATSIVLSEAALRVLILVLPSAILLILLLLRRAANCVSVAVAPLMSSVKTLEILANAVISSEPRLPLVTVIDVTLTP